MLRLTLLATAATFAAAAPYPKDSAWAHAMDKNCCGGGEACGMTYCAGQDTCVQSWEVDDFDTECKPGAAKVQLRRQLQATMPTHVTLSAAAGGGVSMPMSNLGTCCGSDPKVGVMPWIKAGTAIEGKATVGIDTAWDYHDQPDIAKIISPLDRKSLFLTTKIPTGFGNKTDCSPDPDMIIRYMKDNVAQLGVKSVDLALLHHPCDRPGMDESSIDNVLWTAMQTVQKMGLAKAIGVSNYNAAQLAGLKGPKPAVNQCSMGVGHHVPADLAYCLKNGIVYEAYGGMRSCYGTSYTPALQKIADAHKVSAAQVCLRWILDKGAVMAIGTGSDATKIDSYTKEDLAIYSFKLTAAEVLAIDAMKK